MNHHEFAHVLAMIHAEAKRALAKLPAVMEKERMILALIKREIEVFEIRPESILNEKEASNGLAQ